MKDDAAGDNDWPLNELPKWSKDFSAYVTKYFSDMSNGQLKLDVDVFPRVVVSSRKQMDYYYDKQNYGDINTDILKQVDEETSFLPYDNWILEDKYKGYPGQDQQVDLVFMIYRGVSVSGLLGYWGVSDLGFGWKLPVDETKRYFWGGNATQHDDASSSGLTVCKSPGSGIVMDYNSACRLVIHETIHKMYGEGHVIYNFASLGVLSNTYGSLGMSSFEKSTLGYMDYKKIDTLNNTELSLRDYMTTGDAYLIPLPGLTNQYYILENRQKLSVYDEVKYPGLYIYYLQYDGQFSKLDIQTADGKWDWTFDSAKNVVKLRSNPVSGSSHLELANINNVLYYAPEMEGNANDPFTIAAKTLYAPWTNPTTNGKFSAYQDYPTNVYMNLFRDSSGIFRVKLSFKADVVNVENPVAPNEYKLNQNYPNPFNSSTKISYSISKGSFVQIKLYDILGREVKTLLSDYKNAGNYLLDLDAGSLSGGVYFVKMQAGDFNAVKKIVYLR
jgi:hypothetical protein